MNNLYFACTSCKVFVDAGYRWAYWTLEDAGIVTKGGPVDPAKVLAAEEYWNPEKEETSNWLYNEVFPSVRTFLEEHGPHKIIYGEIDLICDSSSDWFLEWIQEGFLAYAYPRFCLERLHHDSWDAVRSYMDQQKSKPRWWTEPDERERAERWFKASLIRKQATS
jgi:hypothetical protein